MLRAEPRDSGPAASAAAFLAGLQEENAALVAFKRTLHAAQEALVEGDADRLGQLATDMASHIDLLARLGEQRSRHLAAQNLSAGAEGMAAWLKRNPEHAATGNKTWRELLAQAETSQQINQNNGVLIETRLQQNRLNLAVLQTVAASDGVYRPDGKMHPLRNTRTFSQV